MVANTAAVISNEAIVRSANVVVVFFIHRIVVNLLVIEVLIRRTLVRYKKIVINAFLLILYIMIY
jgi:hypothetical protein